MTITISNTIINLTNPQPTKPTTTKNKKIDNYKNYIIQKSINKYTKTIINYFPFNLIKF